MANQNSAAYDFARFEPTRREEDVYKRQGREAAALDELSRLLGLPKPPAYIEAYDISNLQGGENVAGMVVFEDGRPLKSAYRKMCIRDV